MDEMKGIRGASRRALSLVLRRSRGTVSVADVATALRIPRPKAGKMLAGWCDCGWLSRVRRGLYVPVPLDASSADVIPEDPWLIAERLFAPCYIGGWTAAEHWGLTEQIFRTTVVMTTRRPSNRNPEIKGLRFRLKTIPSAVFFGVKNVWRDRTRVAVSDPSRTILDLFDDPSLGGGIRPSIDIFRNYLDSASKNLRLLIDYGDQLGNRAVFKRLGFVLEKIAPAEHQFISDCKMRLSAGNAKLDPALPAQRLMTRWKLWVPRTWAERVPSD